MRPETLAILQNVDSATEWESPTGFNYNAAMSRVRLLKLEVERLAGRVFTLDENVQDASFFTELALITPLDSKSYVHTILALRFSAFGNLFCSWSLCKTEQLPAQTIQQIIALTEKYGFIHIEQKDLRETYSGKHSGFQGASWGLRFFDYV